MSNSGRFLFGTRSLDLSLRELSVDGQTVATEPKVFDLIEYLLQHRDRVVSKPELQEKLWPNVVVTEASLSRTVMKARKALQDDAHEPEVIRTVARRGFRFMAPVREAGARVYEVDGLSDVHFVSDSGVHIAWRTLGEGDSDVLFASGFASHLDNRYRIGPIARFDAALGAGRRLISFDKRSVGLSDRIGKPPTLDDTVADMKAVLDAARSKRATIFAVCESGPAACRFAARYPDRVAGLILYGTFAKGQQATDYPHMPGERMYNAWLQQLISQWGGPASIELFAPSLAHDPDVRDAWARYLRSAATPGVVRGILESLRDIDVRAELAQIECPALVLHRTGDQMIRIGAGRDIAARIPGAKIIELEGADHWWFVGNAGEILQAAKPYL